MTKVKLWTVIVAIALWVVVLASALSFYAWRWLHEPQIHFARGSVYTIPHGASLHSIAADLSKKSKMHWPRLWIAYAQFSGLSNIKVGEFQLDEAESPISLLQKFHSGQVVQYRVTFVEGSRFQDAVRALHAHKKIRPTFAMENAREALAASGINVEHPEGWFYPDTYLFTAGDSDMSVLKRAYNKMQGELTSAWAERAQDLPYATPYEALVMASIVEKETGVAYERGEIAGVFVRRLKKNMRLQTDPTVIYGMGERYNGNITRKNLREPTAYNTYVIRGLPPTPIALPGRAALAAAVNPKGGDTLFFVAKGDGTHHFSETLNEHNQAVYKYQKKQRRQDYRSHPPADTTVKEGK